MSLGIGADDGAVEEEVVTVKIWTVHAQTMSRVEGDSDIFLQEELKAALPDFADDATHQGCAAITNTDNDDLLGDYPLHQMRYKTLLHWNPAKASRRLPSVPIPHWSFRTKLR